MNRLTKGLACSAFLLVLSFIVVPAYSQTDSNKADNVPTPAALLNDKGFQADAMYYDALKARIKGDDKEEEKLLAAVVSLNPDASGAYYDLSRLSFKQNRADKATEFIKKAIAINDSNVWYKRQYAEILSLSNKFEEAANQFMQIAKLDKNNQDDLYKAAKLYQHVGKYDEALAAIDLLLKQDADNEEIIDQKKSLYLKRNDVGSVAKIIQQQIDNNPHDGKYVAELAELYDNNKMPGEAVALYKRLESEYGDEAIVQYTLANYYKKNNNTAKYREYTRKVITNPGLDVEAQLAFLGAYIMESRTDSVKMLEGLELSKLLSDKNPNNANVLIFYGDAMRMNGKVMEAAPLYKRAVQIEPSNYNAWETLLLIHLNRNDADSLILYSERALRLFPNQAMLHYLNGLGYSFKGDYVKAAKSINRAIDMQPEDKASQLVDMYIALGDVQYYLKEYTLSDESYEKALKMEPNNATALNNYAYYLSVRGTRLEDAERMSKKSLDIRKDEPTFLDTYGWIFYKQGKYDKALEYIQKAIDLTGENADGTLWEHLGDAYYKSGKQDKAVECWMKAKVKGSDNPNIDKKINDKKLYES